MMQVWQGGQIMKIEVVGFTCRKIEAIKAYRETILPMLKLKDAKIIIDSIERGNPIPLMLDENDVNTLLAAGFEIEFPTQREVKILMNQLIQRFLSMGKKKYANQLIQMWLELIKEEGD